MAKPPSVTSLTSLSVADQLRIREKRQRLLDEKLYGKPSDPDTDRWIEPDQRWLVREHWEAPEAVMKQVAAEYTTEGGTDWCAVQDHLPGVEEAYRTYGDPGDPGAIYLVDYEFRPPFPINYITATFDIETGGGSDDA
ncbi:hypothetical protein N9917_05100 [Deltaproteobacteria bacterium]|nr:hypothetical protein [Deltaproteobacteria bacterium]